MPVDLTLRKGLEADRAAYTGLEGELAITTDERRLYLHDGATAGGLQMNRLKPVYVTANYVAKDGDLVVPNGSAPITITLPDPATLTSPAHIGIAPESLTFDAADALEPAGPNLISIATAGGTVNGLASYTVRQPNRIDAIIEPPGTDWKLTGFSDVLSPTPWVTPTLQNGFIDVKDTLSGEEYEPFAYRRLSNGLVMTRGALAGPITNNQIFQFATGFVPKERVLIAGQGVSTGAGERSTNIFISGISASFPGRVVVSNVSPATMAFFVFDGVFSVL